MFIFGVLACGAVALSCGEDNGLWSRCRQRKPLAAKVGYHIFPPYDQPQTLALFVWTYNPLGDSGFRIRGDVEFSPGADTIRLELRDVYICGGSSVFYPAWNRFIYPTQASRPHILEFILHFGDEVTVVDRHRITIIQPDSILFEPIKADSTYHRRAEEWYM